MGKIAVGISACGGKKDKEDNGTNIRYYADVIVALYNTIHTCMNS